MCLGVGDSTYGEVDSMYGEMSLGREMGLGREMSWGWRWA